MEQVEFNGQLLHANEALAQGLRKQVCCPECGDRVRVHATYPNAHAEHAPHEEGTAWCSLRVGKRG